MLQELLALLPKDAPPYAVPVGFAIAVAGMMLWLIASKFSRYFVALLTVALGATIGMHLPKYLGWSVSGAGPAVAAAVVLGIAGFVLDGMWMGFCLGICCSLWVTFVCWVLLRNGQTWTWPAVATDTTVFSYAHQCWILLPGAVSRILPFGAAASIITGLATAILWPRLTIALSWSMTGLTFAVLGGLVAMNYGRPDLLGRVPSNSPVLIGVLAGLLLFGTGIQWKIMPAARSRRRSGRSASKKSDSNQQIPEDST